MQLDLFAKALRIRFEEACKNPIFPGLFAIVLLIAFCGLVGLCIWGGVHYPATTMILIGTLPVVALIWWMWPRLSDIEQADKPEREPAKPVASASHLPLKQGHTYRQRMKRHRISDVVTIVLVEGNDALGSDGTTYDTRTGRFHSGLRASPTEWDLVREVFDDSGETTAKDSDHDTVRD